MARVVEWSDQAIRDVEELTDYIGRSSPQNAAEIARAIRSAALDLERFPLAHRMVPEHQDAVLRETFVHKWRLMYRVFPDRIRVVGVVHGARILANDPGRSFEESPQQDYVAS